MKPLDFMLQHDVQAWAAFYCPCLTLVVGYHSSVLYAE